MTMLARPPRHPAVVWTRRASALTARLSRVRAPAMLARSIEVSLGLLSGLQPELPPAFVWSPPFGSEARADVATPEARQERRAAGGDGASLARAEAAVRAYLQRYGVHSWAELADRVRAAASYAEAARIVRGVLRPVPRERALFLLAHAPAPFPAHALEALQTLDASAVQWVSGNRPEGGVPVGAAEVAEALGLSTPHGRPRALFEGHPGELAVPVALRFAIDVSAWGEIARIAHYDLPGTLLRASIAGAEARLRERDHDTYARLCALSVGDARRVVQGTRPYASAPPSLWELARNARDTPEAWRETCAAHPAAALVILGLWTAGAPAWWTRAEIGSLLTAGSRDQRLAALALLAQVPELIDPARGAQEPGAEPGPTNATGGARAVGEGKRPPAGRGMGRPGRG